MDNTLKCRVWDKTTKTMHYHDFVITSTGYIAKINRCKEQNIVMCFEPYDLLFEKDKIALKCTGLEDKNGNLIYQGDILKESYVWENKKETDITVVEWLESGASFAMLHVGLQNDFTYFNENDVDLSNFEVIGNKYENPELLKAK